MVKNLGKQIQDAREKKGLSRYRLGMSIGFQSGQVKDIEQGKIDPRSSTLEKIAKALETNIVIRY